MRHYNFEERQRNTLTQMRGEMIAKYESLKKENEESEQECHDYFIKIARHERMTIAENQRGEKLYRKKGQNSDNMQILITCIRDIENAINHLGGEVETYWG